MKDPLNIWLAVAPDERYQRARRYLNLKLPGPNVGELITKLQEGDLQFALPEDILQAAGQKPLDPSHPSVRRDLRGLIKGEKFSPIMVVSLLSAGCCDIADGMSRLSAASYLDPRSSVPYYQARMPCGRTR